jgi:hypothetical protein
VSPPSYSLGNVSVLLSFNTQQYMNTSFFFQYKDDEFNFFEENKRWLLVTFGFLILYVFGFVVLFWKRKGRAGYSRIPSPKSKKRSMSFVEVPFQEITLGQKIGRGSAGDVYKATWNGATVAVKLLPPLLLEKENFREQLIQEADIMKSLRHPNVLQFLGVCTIYPNICLITEYMPLGSLYQQIHNETLILNAELLVDIKRCIKWSVLSTQPHSANLASRFEKSKLVSGL